MGVIRYEHDATIAGRLERTAAQLKVILSPAVPGFCWARLPEGGALR
jgi:hypothetical protein